MKKLLFTCFSMFIAAGLMAQCSDLFISEYVEGSHNNKALELYNPTPNAINLSGYAIGRFSNGSLAPSNGGPIVLPNIMLQPYRTYVIVLDRRQADGTAPFDLPVWDGYNVFDVATDAVTNDTIIDFCRDAPLLVPQHIDGDINKAFVYGTTYNATYDLQAKRDTFACPDYDLSNGMSFNGNDAVFLISGDEVDLVNATNIIDVVGVIGEDPTITLERDGWVDAFGKVITENITITRRAGITQGTGIVALALGDTIRYNEWDYQCNNDFTHLGSHGCDCDPSFVGVHEVVNEIPVNVQPNPTSDWLLVNAPQSIQQIEVYDLAGRQIFQQNYNNFSTEVRLNVNHYHSGMYIVNVIFDDKQRTVKKFVVK